MELTITFLELDNMEQIYVEKRVEDLLNDLKNLLIDEGLNKHQKMVNRIDEHLNAYFKTLNK